MSRNFHKLSASLLFASSLIFCATGISRAEFVVSGEQTLNESQLNSETDVVVPAGSVLKVDGAWNLPYGHSLTIQGTIMPAHSASAIQNKGGTTTKPTILFDGGTYQTDFTTDYVSQTDATFFYYSGARIQYRLGEGGMTFEVNGENSVSRISGLIYDQNEVTPGKVVKTGSGTFQMGVQPYSSVTEIQDGTLFINAIDADVKTAFPAGIDLKGGTLEIQDALKPNFHVNGAFDGSNAILGALVSSKTNTGTFVEGQNTTLALGSSSKAINWTSAGYLHVKDGATVNMTNGTVNLNGKINYEAQTDALRIDGNALMNVNGGTVNANQIRLGKSGAGTMNVAGGTINSVSFFAGGNAPGSLTLSDGTLKASSFLMVGWQDSTNSVFTMTGGTIQSLSLQLGNSQNSKIVVEGGKLLLGRLGNRPEGENPQNNSITLRGNCFTVRDQTGDGKMNSLSTLSNTTLTLEIASDGFSTLDVVSASLAGKTTVGNVGGAGVWDGTPVQLITAESFSMLGALSGDGLWSPEKTDSGLSAVLDPNAKIVGFTDSNDVRVLQTASNKGWTVWNSDVDSLVLNVELTENATLSDFVDWLNQDLLFDHQASATDDGKVVLDVFSKLSAGEAFFWDFSAFENVSLSALEFRSLNPNSVPEPAAWLMLSLAAPAILLLQRKNRTLRRIDARQTTSNEN